MAKRRRKDEVRIKRHVERITSRRHRYTIKVGGTREPENHAIIIENAGKGYVDNPRVRANDKSDWYDTETMVKDTIRGFRTDEEKALALCYLFEGTRFQRGNGDRHSVHPPTLLGVYGYGICGHTAAAFRALLAAAGIRARHWEINHHTVTEAYFDGAWHMLDGNCPVVYLKRDNRTIASMRELEDDPDLVGRTQMLGGRDHTQFREWYTTKPYHYYYPKQNEYAVQKKNLGYVLRPFERFERYWYSTHKYHGQVERAEMPMRLGGGKFIFEPDLKQCDVHDFLRDKYAYAKNLKWSPRRSPVLRVDRPQVPVFDQVSRLTFDVRSPYTIVGGKLCLKMHKSGTDKRDSISVSVRNYDTGRKSPTLFQMMERASGDFEVELDLTPGIQPWGQLGNYFYELVIAMGASGETDPVGVTGINALRLESDVQAAPGALPALTLGENTIAYTDETKGARDIRVIHLWKERTDGRAPRAPTRLAPSNREKVDTLGPTLEWKQPEGTSEIADYQILVSRWSHCRLPHCPNLYGTIGRNATTFNIPLGWLNPGTTYYWKVCAKDTVGDWGPWSKIASFRTAR